jgi:hypothetical protein
MARSSNSNVLDQIAKFFLLLSEVPSYWYSINICFNHAFHQSKRLGMEQDDDKSLLVAANLARYKGGDFMIIVDKWKSFLRGCHFIDLPSDCTPFEVDPKRMVFDGKRQLVYVIRINGRYAGPPTMSFERQTKMDRLPPRISSLRLQQQNFVGAQSLLIAHVHIDLFVGGEEDSLRVAVAIAVTIALVAVARPSPSLPSLL